MVHSHAARGWKRLRDRIEFTDGTSTLERHETQGITVYTAKPHTSANHKQGLFTEEDFRYDAEQDLYRCPAAPSAGVFTQSDDSLGGRIGKQPTPTA